MSEITSLLHRIEAVLFLENQLVEEKRLSGITQIPLEQIGSCVDALNKLYQNSGSILCVKKLAESYQLYVSDRLEDSVLERYTPRKKKLSKAILETLAIIAYKQPVTKIEVDDIRGVNCTSYIRQLFEEDFIKVAGKKNVLGKPNMYRTTNKFLMHFGLTTLKDLPSLKEIKTYDFLEEQELKSPEEVE